MSNAPRRAGRHFLQIPGPTPVPDRILRAMDMPMIDHRGPEFEQLGPARCSTASRPIFKTHEPGGHLSRLRHRRVGGGARQHAVARRQGADVRDRPFRHACGRAWRPSSASMPEFIASRLARAAPIPRPIEARLREDKAHEIKAVCVVHNETSTGAISPIDEVRQAIDAAGHPALLMVDTISSLASIDYRHDEWGVDVTVGGSQKGLMLPPGLGFNAVEREGAGRVARRRKLPQVLLGLGRDARRQQERLLPLHAGDQPALRPRRGDRHAARGRPRRTSSPATTATPRRRGARSRAWGLEVLCRDPQALFVRR